MYEWTDFHSFSYIHYPDTLRTIKLVSACRQQINIHLVNINWYMSICLNCICMEKYSFFMCYFTDFCNRLYCSYFIICCHYWNKNCIFSYWFFKFIQSYFAIWINIQICYIKSMSFKIFTCMKHCMMLNFCCNNIFPFIRKWFCYSLNRPIIRFTSTACEIYFHIRSTYQLCRIISRFFNRNPAFRCKAVCSRRIAVNFRKIRHHWL